MQDLPERLYSKQEVENARTKGQVVGWLQGGGVVVGGMLLLNLLGSWIPAMLVLGGGGYLAYRIFLKPGKKDDSRAEHQSGT